MKKYNIAVVGATGIVGREILSILSESNFPVSRVTALASSAGDRQVSYGSNAVLNVESLESYNFSDDIIFFAAGSRISKEYAKKAIKNGGVVIDSSSCFRMKKEVPLIATEVNPEDIHMYKNHGIISNPNCSTIQLLVPLKPLHDFAKIKRITVSTYQSVSGAGKKSMDELYKHTKGKFSLKNEDPENFPKSIAFNCIPQIGKFDDNGFSDEENKIIDESKKILKLPRIRIEATCVRVPVFVSHAESVTVEFRDDISVRDVIEILEETECIVLQEGSSYSTQAEVAGHNGIFVSRIRQNTKKSISMWIVADNIRKGGALNAVQIADLLKEYI